VHGTQRILLPLTTLTDTGVVAEEPQRQVARKRKLAAQLSRVLLQLGYIPLSEVHQLLDRIGDRMSQIDEPLAREYVLDPFPEGIERKIHQMCQRRKALFQKLAEDELRVEQQRLAGEDNDSSRWLGGTRLSRPHRQYSPHCHQRD
jgi:hypothetical protein